jgi:hypothetical protein
MTKVISVEKTNAVTWGDVAIAIVIPPLGGVLIADKLSSESEYRATVKDGFDNSGRGYGDSRQEAIVNAERDMRQHRR